MEAEKEVRDVSLTLRVKPDVAQLLRELSAELHISRTAVIALAVGELARKYGIVGPGNGEQSKAAA